MPMSGFSSSAEVVLEPDHVTMLMTVVMMISVKKQLRKQTPSQPPPQVWKQQACIAFCGPALHLSVIMY
jgi:hypothetical protein